MEQPFSLTSEVRENRLIITTSGYVNNVGGEAIAAEFARHFEQGTRHIVINLGQSRVVNSVGMSFLIEIIERLQDATGATDSAFVVTRSSGSVLAERVRGSKPWRLLLVNAGSVQSVTGGTAESTPAGVLVTAASDSNRIEMML